MKVERLRSTSGTYHNVFRTSPVAKASVSADFDTTAYFPDCPVIRWPTSGIVTDGIILQYFELHSAK